MYAEKKYAQYIHSENAQIAYIEKKYYSRIKVHELLDSKNIEKFELIHSDKRKIEFVLTRYLLNELIHSVEINYKENGEPIIENNQFISISHCKEIVAIGISNYKIGIDTETIDNKILRIQHKFVHESENNETEFSPEELTIRWCCKEALFKLSELKTYNIKENLRVKKITNNRYVGIIIDENKTVDIEIHRFNDTIICTTL